MVKPKAAKVLVIFLGVLAVGLAIVGTFFDQNLIRAVIGVSSASSMYYLYRNPKILMAKSLDEFGDLYDQSRDKKYLLGFPAYHVLLLSVILYIWLV